VDGFAGYQEFGLTELFFEGAEPSLAEVDLEDLLAFFPEGIYTFTGMTIDGETISAEAELTHDVPAAPTATARVDDDSVSIRWKGVTKPAAILPDGDIDVVGYQVLVGSLDVTLPASSRRLTLPREFVRALPHGEEIGFEVLAIDESANQTIFAGSFVIDDDDDD
jgi:hypothetical protein